VITRIAELGLLVEFRSAFKIGGSHIVKKNIVLNAEEIAHLLRQVRFPALLVRQQGVERSVQAIIIDLAFRNPSRSASELRE